MTELEKTLENLNQDGFNALMKTYPKLKKVLDQRVGQSIETYKENHPPIEPDPPKDPPAGPKDEDPPADDKAALLARILEVNKFAKENELDPEFLFATMGLTDADDATRLEKLLEYTGNIEQQARNKVLGENGRNPHESIQLNLEPLTLEAIANLTPSQQESLSPQVTQAAIEEYSKRGKPTVRQRISASLFGGKS
jgi:hypothetical protein